MTPLQNSRIVKFRHDAHMRINFDVFLQTYISDVV